MAPLPGETSEQHVEFATGSTIRVLRRGSGPALVIAPGWTCSTDVFTHQLAGLADSHEVVAYDPRGRPLSRLRGACCVGRSCGSDLERGYCSLESVRLSYVSEQPCRRLG